MQVYAAELTTELVWIALFSLIAVYLLCRTYLGVKLSLSLSLVVAVVRIVIPFSYFAWWYNPDWTHINGIEYFQIGLQLFETGQTPLILFSIEGIRHLRSLADSWHILQQWWNLVAITLFGRALYTPIFLNVCSRLGSRYCSFASSRTLTCRDRTVGGSSCS